MIRLIVAGGVSATGGFDVSVLLVGAVLIAALAALALLLRNRTTATPPQSAEPAGEPEPGLFEEPARPPATPEAEVVAEPQPEVVAEPEAEVVAEPEAEVVAEPQPEVVAEPEAEVVAEPQPEVVAEPQPEVVAEPQPAPEPVAGRAPGADSALASIDSVWSPIRPTDSAAASAAARPSPEENGAESRGRS